MKIFLLVFVSLALYYKCDEDISYMCYTEVEERDNVTVEVVSDIFVNSSQLRTKRAPG